MPNPKHDYDSEKFYGLLERAASVCYQDKDVATILDLDDTVFSAMKNGCYAPWSAEENARRSERINKVLTRARSQSNMQAWNTMLRIGLGRFKTRSRSVRVQGRPCECKGKEASCKKCGGFGYVHDEDGEIPVVISEQENELAPSLQALSQWLYHHDPTYRKVQRGQDLTDEEQAQMQAQGIDVAKWLLREAELARNSQTPTDGQ